MRKTLKAMVIFSLLFFVAVSAFAASYSNEDAEYRTYFLVTGETIYPDHVRIDFSFRGEESSVLANENGVEVVKFAYLNEAEITRILSSSWVIDGDKYSSDYVENARLVVQKIREYLDSRYPYTGPITAETAVMNFSDTISCVLTPYQVYTVTYFQVLSHITPEEVNYFSATYSFGANLSYDHRFTKDFGVGASLGINSTFGEGEVFLNLSPMFQMAASMFRVGTVEFTTRMGFGGYITINEDSFSFVPGLSASLGLSITVSSNIVFILESGLDVGLWLWRSMSSEGFMMAIQKPLSLGVGVRL